MKVAVLLAVLALSYEVAGDCYLLSPRASNNRLDEANRDRANGNRVFDSQNNNRGGVNVGSVYYYTGSVVPIEWTVQHSCGHPNAACEMVIQYMCDDRLRDGTTTNTIPDNPAQCYNRDCDTDVRFGRHESYNWYQACKARARNTGLYTANQNLNGNGAIYTRQNPNGDRRGYECPEERDYYPYWAPTPWVDVAVLTNQGTRCAAYQAESQNVKDKFYCQAPSGYLKAKSGQTGVVPITQAACEAIFYDQPDPATGNTIRVYGTWTKQAAWGVDAPDCRENQITRDNHHGNGLGGFPSSYNWTVPQDFIHESCALRVRYNISTADYNPWGSDFTADAGENSTTNFPNGNANNDPALTPIWLSYRLSYISVKDSFDRSKNNDQTKLTASREYVLKNNPKVNIFGSLVGGVAMKHQLAINTNQFGRTFQDRTFRFSIRARPAGITGTIYNLNVAGKRGNIVQTYPSHEYFFKPENLMIKNGDFIHFQWSGSNTNPDNNAGQGKAGTDRSNVISARKTTYYYAAQTYPGPATADLNIGPYAPNNPLPTYGHFSRNYPAKITDPTIPFLGFSVQDRETLAILYDKSVGQGQLGGEMSELDDAGTYFDLGPRVVTQNGNYHYMSTRNNNFTNRSQKGLIVVSNDVGAYSHFGYNAATATTGGTTVKTETGAFDTLQTLSVVETPRDGDIAVSLDSSFAASPLVYVAPAFINNQGTTTPGTYSFGTAPGKSVEISIKYNAKAGKPWYTPQVYTSQTPDGAWTTVGGASYSGGVASFQATSGGYFAVQNQPNYAALILIPIAIVIVLFGGGYLFWRYYGKTHCANRCSSLGTSSGPQITSSGSGPRRANV